MSALVTEHFVLQSVSGATISESGTRAAIYLSGLSSGLVAIGFASRSPVALTALTFTVLPTVFLLGCFTVVRLVDTTIENMVALDRMEAIRQFYAALGPHAARFFPPARGVRYGRWSVLSTLASMIAVVNAVLAGATAGLASTAAAGVPIGGAAGIGIGVAVLLVCLSLGYERLRMGPHLRATDDAGPSAASTG